jgi:hypothetical protein
VTIFEPTPGGPQEGNVSLQTWLPGAAYWDEVVRRANAGARWALISLDENDEDDGQGALPVTLG